MNWNDFHLGDLIHVKHGYAFKSKYFSPVGEQIVLTPGNFFEEGGFKLRGDRDRYYTGSYPPGYLLHKGDIIIAMTEQGKGLLGSSSLIPEDNQYLHNQRLGLIKVKDSSKIDPFYLYKIFNTQDIRQQIASSASGIKVRHTSPDRIYRCKVRLPSLPIQKKIAGILAAYDDLIENNLKRIKLLEEMAQITYEEWFVRLRFPDHKTTPKNLETGLPDGWKERSFGSLLEHEIGGGWGNEERSEEFPDPAHVIRGTDIDGLIFGQTDKVPFRYHKISNLQSRALLDGDVVFEVSGGSQNEGVAKTAYINKKLLNFFDEKVMCASFCKLARPKIRQEGVFIFHFLRFLRKSKRTEVFEIRSASNIVNYNWQAFMKFQMIKTPIDILMDDFCEYADNIHNQIYDIGRQNQLLREARDILLPRLMAGMIDVEQYNPADLRKEAA